MSKPCIFLCAIAAFFVSQVSAQSLPRDQWGAPAVTVTHTNGQWLISGRTNQVTLTESDLALTIKNGAAGWAMVPSGAKDMLVKSGTEEFFVRLSDARQISIVPYDTGFKT